MLLLVMILQRVFIVEVLVAWVTVVMPRAVPVMLEAGFPGGKVSVTVVADPVVQRVVLVLLQSMLILEAAIAAIAVWHLRRKGVVAARPWRWSVVVQTSALGSDVIYMRLTDSKLGYEGGAKREQPGNRAAYLHSSNNDPRNQKRSLSVSKGGCQRIPAGDTISDYPA